MANCYWCGCEISKDNISDEHIIKQSFGGIIYSTKLLCRNHNSELGKSLDSDFSKEMDYIAIALNLNIKNIHKKFIRMYNEEGEEVWVGAGLKALSYIILKKGEKEIKIPNIPDEDLEAQANKKKKELEKNGDGIFEFKEVQLPPTFSTLYFHKDKSVGFGSDSYHLGFLKIAIGFSLHNDIKRKYLDHAIDVLKGKLKDFKIESSPQLVALKTKDFHSLLQSC